jgi:hypothetical protein
MQDINCVRSSISFTTKAVEMAASSVWRTYCETWKRPETAVAESFYTEEEHPSRMQQRTSNYADIYDLGIHTRPEGSCCDV